ncbi:MAG: hypothetical protein HC910_21450 [Spirulinaceae cyanobacterium SM2_1_0]|nr:hypothetical protein [Spirulinaceae cyanobacterium SM2_1_0]
MLKPAQAGLEMAIARLITPKSVAKPAQSQVGRFRRTALSARQARRSPHPDG